MLGLSLGSWHQSQYDDPKSSSRQKKSQKPNIVLILTDDQDEMLGNHALIINFDWLLTCDN